MPRSRHSTELLLALLDLAALQHLLHRLVQGVAGDLAAAGDRNNAGSGRIRPGPPAGCGDVGAEPAMARLRFPPGCPTIGPHLPLPTAAQRARMAVDGGGWSSEPPPTS